MKNKVQKLLARLVQVEDLLGLPETVKNQKQYRELTQEHSYLSRVKSTWDHLYKCEKELSDNKELLELESDQAFTTALKEEIEKLEHEIEHAEAKMKNLLVPPDPNDNRNTILEIRAGTGGDEAALFVGDCVRMYKLYAENRGWRYEMLSSTPSDVGGYKEYVMVVTGPEVYRLLRHEGGTHRVQRVPDTETQGRVHTSAVTIAVMLEPDEEEDIDLDEKDLRIDTYRSSGAGGQHVNTTDSAVRITHIPTGTVAYCQEERSQHKNRDKALRLLKAKIVEAERIKAEKERASHRAAQVGTGDRSERIRTYNYPQNRVTDHRINKTLYSLDRFMEGDLDDFTEALVQLMVSEELNS